MSIQTKFMTLLAMLSLVVAIGMGAAAWAVLVIYNEVALGFASRAVALNGLVHIERNIQLQRSALRLFPAVQETETEDALNEDPPGEPIDPRQFIGALVAQMYAGLTDLEALPGFRREIGYSTSANLHQRIDEYVSSARQWVADPAGGSSARMLEDLIEIEQLIESINSRILQGTMIDIDHAAEMRHRVTAALLLAVAGTVLTAVLGVLLVRRWVSRPVAALRTATATIAAGDFSHRVAVQGRDEIAQLGKDINYMAGMVAHLQQERVETERLAAVGEVVRRLVHNLRNPMAGIRGLAELSRAESEAGSDIREQQDRIIKTVDRFERWLSELLSLTKPQAIDPSPQEVAAWLPPVVETLRPQAETRGVTLDVAAVEQGASAIFDPRHLEQAVVAILANAIDASPRGGVVRISTKFKADCWELVIADQGSGIPVHLRDQVFKPYFTTKPDGNGIGLAVTQQIVRAHGGRVTLGSGSGAGGGSENARFGAVAVLLLPLNGPDPSKTLSS